MRFRKRFTVVLVAVLGLLATTVAPAGAIIDLNTGDAFDPIVSASEFPDWAVRVNVNGSGCSGALIDVEFVLTAAHCLLEDTNASQVTVQIGASRISRGIAELFPHPNFDLPDNSDDNQGSSEFDIAIFQLSAPAPADYDVLKIGELPNSVGSFSTSVYGFGTSGGTVPFGTLQESRQVASLDFEALTYHKLLGTNDDATACDTHRLLCMNTSASARTGLCEGDSGGPVVRKFANSQDVLVGVLNTVENVGNNCGVRESVSAASYAPHHANWIRETIAYHACGRIDRPDGSRVVMIAWGEGSTSGNDVIVGTNQPETLSGGDGHDQICGRAGNDTIYGGLGEDLIEGGLGADWISGGGDRDELYGDFGADIIYGGDGSDTIYGGFHGDSIFGQSGQDTIHGEDGSDFIDGGIYNDFLVGGTGNDTIRGGGGVDTLYGGDGDDDVRGGGSKDYIFGQDGDDVLHGHSGADEIEGGNGDDDIRGDAGDDIIDAGPDNDLVRGGKGADSIKGGHGDDYLYGDKGKDKVEGQGGDDHLFGNAGADTIDGGLGADEARGGPGSDSCKNASTTSSC